MKIAIQLLIIILGGLLFYACEDEIEVDLEEGRSQLVVDAFLTNDSNAQVVKLSLTAPYFLNQPTPDVIRADVKVIGPSGEIYVFQDQGNGNYRYNPSSMGPLDSLGFTYRLQLTYQGKDYMALSRLNPVPDIDSMTYAFEEEELGAEEGYYTQFWATDFLGRKDYYWIKAFKNGDDVRPEQPAALILSEDAAFNGDGADGFVFILPIRSAITNEESPFAPGDISSVELLSLNQDVFEFLDQVSIQANNGGLFSTPPANIRSNIRNADGSLQEEVLGVFSLSSISKASIQIIP